MPSLGMTERARYRGLRRTLSRDALLGAAVELIGTRGFAAVSIDDIVASAGVVKGTFYNHFDDKQDIAHHVALGIRHEIRDWIAEVKIRSSDPAIHLAIALTLLLNLAVASQHKAQMLVQRIRCSTRSPSCALIRELRRFTVGLIEQSLRRGGDWAYQSVMLNPSCLFRRSHHFGAILIIQG